MSKLKQLGQITVLAQVMNLVPFVIITFIFDKAVYGEFASTMSVAGVLGISSALKLDIYNLDKKQGFHYLDILSYLFPLWLCYVLALWFFKLDVVLGVLVVLSIGIYDFTSNSLLQTNQITRFNRFRLLRVCTGIFGYLILWLVGVTVNGLLIVEILTRLIPIFFFRSARSISLKRFDFQDAKECTIISLGWTINNSVILLIPFIMGNSVDLLEVGWYFLFYKGINQVEVLFASTVNQYIVSLNEREILNGYLNKLGVYTFFYVLSIVITSSILATFIAYVFGYKSDLFMFGACVILFSGLGSPFYIILNMIGESKFQFKWDVTRFVLFLILLLVARIFDFQYFLIGLPLLMILTYMWMHIKILAVAQIRPKSD